MASAVAVAAVAGPRARAVTTEGTRMALASFAPDVPDGLAAEQAWAMARDERLAQARAAEGAAAREAGARAAEAAARAAEARARAARARAARARVVQPPPTVVAARTAPVVRGDIVWPAAGAVTGVFGEPRGSGRHPGIDIDGETGDPVWAAAAGTVTWAGPAPAGYSGYGTLVIVDHGNNLVSLYAHLSAVTVAQGQQVRPGDNVGRIGTTGHSTGSHLHFEVRRDNVAFDPATWLPPR